MELIRHFFWSMKLNFSRHSQKTMKRLFWQKFLRCRQMLTKKSGFFGACSPSKLEYSRANGAFRKILELVGQKWMSEIITEGDTFLLVRGVVVQPSVVHNLEDS